jgi:hypothetical protein
VSYQSPMLIREPNLRWPVYLLSALITTLLVLLMVGVLHVAQRSPLGNSAVEPRLEGALRPGMPEFEQHRERIVVERLTATESPRAINDLAVEMNAAVRNTTERAVSGLEIRGAVLDAQRTPIGERTVVVVPTRQTALEPGESISVRILLEGISPEAERAGLLMEVTGLRFD